MILYNVTVKVNHGIHDEWRRWMLETHIPEVMATGLFTEYQFSQLLEVDDADGPTYAIQYLAPSREAYQVYQSHFAPRLQAAHRERFQDQCLSFRSVLKVVDRG